MEANKLNGKTGLLHVRTAAGLASLQRHCRNNLCQMSSHLFTFQLPVYTLPPDEPESSTS